MNALVTHSANLRAVDFGDAAEVARIERFVDEHRGSVFQRPLWLSAIAEGTGNQAQGIVVERGTTLAGWLPLTLVHSPCSGERWYRAGSEVGGGMLVLRERDIDFAGAASELAQRLCVPSIELRDAVAPDGWDTIEGKHANFARDLAEDDDAQLLSIPRKARAEVRKGLANDLIITVGSSEQDRAAHYAVYAESVHNLGTPVFPRSLFDAVLDRFGDDADILTVSHGGRPTASVLSLYHDGTVMPFWGGGTFAARNLRANERMYYELMLHARRKGCTRFDFGRSKTGSGPFSFKKNGALSRNRWSTVAGAPGSEARNIDPTDAGYSAKIELWKRLPLTLANRIGPAIARGLG